MKTLKLFSVIIFILIPLISFGQKLDASNNSSKQLIEPTVSANQMIPAPVRVENSISDEYGESGENDFLGGLGSTGGYMAVPDAGGLYNLTTGGTVEAWIMPTATTSSSPVVVGKGDNTNVGFVIYWQASSSLMGIRIGNSSLTNIGGTLVPLNVWSHIAVTWAGTPGNYTVTFYVNGAISGAPAGNAGTFNAATLADSLTIGSARANFGGKNFYGYIDEVKIWNYDRTQAQIAQSRFVGIGDYTSANTGNAITAAANYTGLISSWTFNQHFRDDIGGNTGYARNGAGLYWYAYTAGFPIPYNFALNCTSAAGVNDYVTIPENSVFDQTSQGSFEAWIYLNAVGVLQPIFQKGSAFATTTLAAYVSVTNKFGINIGSHNYFPSSSPVTFVANKWYHVAATWSGGPNFTVNTYVNGQLDYTATYNLAMPTVTGPAWIGRYYSAVRFNGYIDEVRFWSNERTIIDIQNKMFASCRSLLPNANLVGAWNFDGNLKNFAATTGIDGSFNTGGTNNCRLSAYKNESTPGPAPDIQFIAFPTVLNCTGFPAGFTKRTINVDIPDNATLTDTIKAAGFAGNLADIQVFLAIQHQKVNDLTIKLKAPNNTEVILSAAMGFTSPNGFLTVLDDSIGNSVNSGVYLSPWTQYAIPLNAMGTFGNTVLNGNWVLTITDGAATNTGKLLSWGLRFNNSILVNSNIISSIIPDKFKLYQNYPNPFNPVTKIKFEVPKGGLVKIAVYDVLGREVKTILNEAVNPGVYDKEFDGSYLSSGIYYCKMVAGEYTNVKKMILIK
ncbi:MAG TPA: LamG-like jellyroll fold domain-containing protein [Ignavibacteria bacterium]